MLAGFYKKFRDDPPVTTSVCVFRNDESFTPYKSRFHGRPAIHFLGAARLMLPARADIVANLAMLCVAEYNRQVTRLLGALRKDAARLGSTPHR